MTPSADLVSSILPNIFKGEISEEKIFMDRVSENYSKLEELPILKVESVNNTNASFASNKYHARTYRIQIQIFININDTDIEELIDKLDRGLEEYEFFQTYGEEIPHSSYENVQVLTRQYTHTRRK